MGFKSIVDKPKIRAMWDELENDTHPVFVSISSTQIYHWVCEIGHKFVCDVKRLWKTKYKCPECLLLAKEGQNVTSLLEKIEDYQWHETKNKRKKIPRLIYWQSRVKYWWICENNHEFMESPRGISEGMIRCPVCRFGKMREANSLSYKHPDLVAWLDRSKNPAIPAKAIPSNSLKVFHWVCTNGHEFKLNVKAMVWLKKCPVCHIETKPLVEI